MEYQIVDNSRLVKEWWPEINLNTPSLTEACDFNTNSKERRCLIIGLYYGILDLWNIIAHSESGVQDILDTSKEETIEQKIWRTHTNDKVA